MGTPKILSRYILRQFLTSFIAVFLSLGFIIYVFDVVDYMKRQFANQDFGFGSVLLVCLLKQPNMLQIILPFIVLIATIVCLCRMVKTSELVIIRASGRSVWQFIMPILVTSGIIGILNFSLFNPLSAKFYTEFERLNDQRRGEAHINTKESDLWLREHNNGKMYVLHAGRIRQEKIKDKKLVTIKDISILEFDEKDEFTKRTDSVSAWLDEENGQFVLNDVTIFQAGFLIKKLPTSTFKTNLTVNKIQSNFASTETISFWDLPGLIEFFDKSGFSSHSQRLQLHSLLVTPLTLIAMVLIAAVFSIDPNQRGGGGALRITAAIMFGFLLFFLSRITYAMGYANNLPIVIATWAPPFIFIFVAVARLFHKEDG
ncbi:MAG: LPS export ABC transporter permease LptG [Alphaproteobacteria bacterium]|nr:LPS export ABC transporter permease LptG [Alphaproteobacteria bacterium]